MKKILITGANSYIGISFETYLKQRSEKYQIDTIDMIDGSWRDKSFTGYNSVYHVAGIADSDAKKVSGERKAFYYKINTDLTIETAKKSKADGAKQFIFMSSAIVYGDSAPIGKQKVISKDIIPTPVNFYGDSKLQAENGLKALEDESFKVVIIRSAMVYGENSKGNYPILAKYALKLPIFPYVKNERSMIYIDNLMEFVRLMVENEESGVFWPQNEEYTNTSEMVKLIAEVHGKKIYLVKGFTWALKLLSHFSRLVNKAFGNHVYEKSISKYKQPYQLIGLRESIVRTEN